jgi:anthranilate synthase component 1
MEVSPTLAEARAYDGSASFAAISTSMPAGGLSPLQALKKLGGRQPGSFLLESSTGEEEIARYSFLGAATPRRITIRDGWATVASPGGDKRLRVDDPLAVLREELSQWSVWAPQSLPRFFAGAVGYLGFDCVRYFEPVPLPEQPGLGLPEAVFLLSDEVCIFDHLEQSITLVVLASLGGDRVQSYESAVARMEELRQRLTAGPEAAKSAGVSVSSGSATPGPLTANRSRQNMEEAVSSARQAIMAGEVFQVVVSQRLSVATEVDALEIYEELRSLNPSPYMFYLQLDSFTVVGASPEVLVRLDKGNLLLRPIAGTRPRGATPSEDRQLEEELLADEKELAEHRMLVDLGRNDLGRVSAVGTVRVERPMHIEHFSHVMHLVTDIRSRLADGVSAYDVLRACFPAGTVSGAPKIRACELIAELEPDRRGVYSGAVGFFNVDGSMDTCIAIRTLVVTPDAVHIQAGAGLVFDSVPAREYEECLHKAGAGLAAVGVPPGAEPHYPQDANLSTSRGQP